MQNKFNTLFEAMMASAGGVFGNNSGDHGGAVGNSDWYATGDARIPKILGIGSKSKKKKCKKCKHILPVVKRSIYMGM